MPKKIQKTLQDYLFKIKSPTHPQIQSPLNILSSCKHPKTPSLALCNNINHNDDAATLADVDRFLLENFKSLYFKDDEEETQNKNNTKRVTEESNEESPKLASILFESPRLLETPRDLCGSARFFVKPGFSGSLMETTTTTCDEAGSTSNSTSISTTTLLNGSPSNSQDLKEAMDHTLPENCIALLTYSPNPYEDFRRSMQDMVEARSWNRERVIDWDFMEELLFCYLNLNEKKSHKFILIAFVDLITVMRRNFETAPAKPRSVRTVRELRKKTKETTLEFRSS